MLAFLDMVRSLVVLLFACVVAPACAPSHRMVHDGNVYFEQCYGAEFNQRVSPELREACWMAWLANYTRHQPAHRIDYAMRRVEAIQTGDQTLFLPGVSGGVSRPPIDSHVAVKARAYQAHLGANVATTVQQEGQDAATPPHGCEASCENLQAECNTTCPPDAPPCQALCKRDAAICRRGCY